MILAIAFVVWAVLFFANTLMLVFFIKGRNWQPSGKRLFQDAMISGTLAILSIAYAYRVLGILPPHTELVGITDYLYFSAVTFSTLGFGDFSPSPNARLIAAIEAIFGNLHLGIIVGAIFLSAPSQKT